MSGGGSFRPRPITDRQAVHRAATLRFCSYNSSPAVPPAKRRLAPLESMLHLVPLSILNIPLFLWTFVSRPTLGVVLETRRSGPRSLLCCVVDY